MKVHLKALGCRLNEAELEQWSRQFQAQGHGIALEADEADVVVVNTCAVTMDATKKSRKLLNRLHRENPESRLVVTGCYATLDAGEVATRLGVDLVVPNSDKDELPTRVMDAFEAPTMPLVAMEPGSSPLYRRSRQRAFIKVQDGCRYRCTFCIVTVARGEERSRSMVDIIDEVNAFYGQGVKEVVLTGVHVGGYGGDLDTSLYELVKTLLAETEMPRIRFASVEPWDLPDSFFSLFENRRIMPHMHLPLQSGADSVLRRMSRRCKTAEFGRLIEQARSAIPDFNVTSDIIVGFPGETDFEWQQTLETVESIGFGHLHIFSYSPRQGTKAARLPNPVPVKIARQRSRELHELADKMKHSLLQQQLGKKVEVLWEGASPANIDGYSRYTGYTPNFMKVETIVEETVSLSNQMRPTHLAALSQRPGILSGQIS